MSTSKYAVFVNASDDFDLLRRHFADASVVRVSLSRCDATTPAKCGGAALWVDAGFDGFPDCVDDSGHWRYYKGIQHGEYLRSHENIAAPDRSKIKSLVSRVLDKCAETGAKWITVPQLAQGGGADRNKVNKLLARAAAEWRESSRSRVQWVFPVIFTAKGQLAGKTAWGPRIKNARKVLSDAGFERTWIVDGSLADWKGTADFESRRFPELIRMHESLREELGRSSEVLAGPYWGMNLVLWARGLVDIPVVGMGTGYQYISPGGVVHAPKAKVALPPLRKFVPLTNELRKWLLHPEESSDSSGFAPSEFVSLANTLSDLALGAAWRRQVVVSYRSWMDRLLATPPAGRAFALYQDLSTAYVLGTKLREIPGAKGRERRPDVPSRQLMLNCL